MSLYKDWSDMVVNYIKTNGEAAFWEEYGTIEKNIYKDLLGKKSFCFQDTIANIARKNDTNELFAMGFLDGINDSLKETLDLENLEKNTMISLDIDVNKLYFNMLDAKADYLYELKEWDDILSQQDKKDIKKEWTKSVTATKEDKVGRNDPCPCGSGKKYKKCCGKNN
ncbi:MAG: SEC-C metal-binding domain-containing protein [Clostridiaceae bacterium]